MDGRRLLAPLVVAASAFSACSAGAPDDAAETGVPPTTTPVDAYGDDPSVDAGITILEASQPPAHP